MPTKISFALEYTLGHVTHADNLKSALLGEVEIVPTYFNIPYDNTPLPAPWAKIGPIKNNWTARASIAAYRAIKSTIKDADAAFFHTQITSIFSAGLMHRLPSIVSLDATPVQYDALGSVYNHTPGSIYFERLKKKLNVRAFSAAKGLITWSNWAKQSLVDDYGITSDKITVIPPGIDLEKWQFPRMAEDRHAVRFLFVGGDFTRKGGDTLLEAYRVVQKVAPSCQLDIVTKSTDLVNLPLGVTVHNGLKANTPELMELYATADVFAFPTRGDCLPLAVMEAMAAGLPVISTDVGALSEAVIDGVTGLIVDVDNAEALANAMLLLAADGHIRTQMGSRGREQAQVAFDAKLNYQKLVQSLLSVRN
jgi:glycosyltransferase involved in cell wall biosynthesis